MSAAVGSVPGVRSRADEHPSIWTFIIADLALFGVFFAIFIVMRSGDSEVFDRSARALDARLGLLNTLILMTSSWLVVRALRAVQQGRRVASRRWLAGGIAVGACFALIKAIEYSAKLGGGLTMHSNDFFMLYYTLTGIHLVHFVIGLGLLALAYRRLGAPTDEPGAAGFLESSALYWHMVDLLWVMLFPLLYLLGDT